MKNRDHDTDRLDLESPLGLSDQPIATTEADHVQGSADGARKRRRARALGEDGIERDHTGSDVNTDPDGAAGIDMGYGGEGTDVTTRRR
jgi:hypothetical protein